jgi:LuxR family transcriptional regulator, maltose regulon positive regulatory protein
MLNIPVSKTKIIPPRRRDELLERKRLLDMLFEALDKKLTLVSAPAGYGKTSLLIDLVKQSEYKSCWLSLDELDREPQRFVAYLLASIAQQFPGFGQQTAAVLNGLTSIQHEMERLAVMLVNEAYEMINEHFVLILDDFHILENDTPIHEFLNRFIQLVDDNCHIIISSRTLAALPDLPLMVAREQVSGLSFFDLSFRKEEIQALILQNHKTHVSDEDAQKLIDETEGWITGLQFSGNNFVHREKSKPVLSITGVGLFDFLGQQVVDRLKPELQEFLLRTSIMDEFDAQLCEKVLASFYPEKQDWDGYIKAVTQNNLFALPVGADGRSLRYHHLFRDYLRARMQREKKDEIKTILKHLGQAYEFAGEWEKAHYFVKQLGDLEALAGIIERASHNNLHRTLPVVENWLNDLPPSIVKNHPGILSVSGAIKLVRGEFQIGISLLDRAVEVFRREGNISGLAMALIRRSGAYRSLGDYPTSIQNVDEAISLTEGLDEFQSLHAEALRIKGGNLVRFGQNRLALDFFERSYEIILRLDERRSVPDLLMEIGVVHHNLGNYPKAEKIYLEVLKSWKQNANIWAQAGLLNNLGNLYHQEGEYEKSAQFYEEGLICCQRSGGTRAETLISIGLGDLHAELQDFEAAQKSYQYAESLFREKMDQYLLLSLQVGRVNLALFQKDIATAEELISNIKTFVKPDQSHYENGFLDFVSGKLYMNKGQFAGAIQALTSAEAHFEQDGHELEYASVRVWLAAALWAGQKREQAIAKITELVNGRGRVPHLAMVAMGQSDPWINGMQKDAHATRAIRDLFSKTERIFSKFPMIRRQIRRQAQVIQVQDPHLYIRAFGRSMVSVGGKTLNISDWQTQSVRDLFFFFLTQSQPLSKEQVAEILWPEIEEPSKIRLRFKNELYRLRRAVGQDVVLFKNQAYSFDRNLDYEYDVEAFESYLSRAKSAKTIEEQVGFYRKAVDLVEGPYLNDLYFDWLEMDRQRLRVMYSTALLTLADLYQQQANLEDALDICTRAIENDPASEEAYCLAMQIHYRLGDRQAIRRTYQACFEALQAQSMPLSRETEDLYHRLMS